MNVAVFCSSSDRVSESFREAAHSLGNWLASEGHILVYGGATGGLMDDVAMGVRERGGDIIGIIPQSIAEAGRASKLPEELFTVDTLAERKEMMMEYADLFVALPGGFGTLDEMMSTISACKVGETDARTIIVNIDGFFDGLLCQIERFTRDGLGKPNDESCYLVVNSAEELTRAIALYAEHHI